MNTLITLGLASRETKLQPNRVQRDPAGSTIVNYCVYQDDLSAQLIARAVWDFGVQPPQGLNGETCDFLVENPPVEAIVITD